MYAAHNSNRIANTSANNYLAAEKVTRQKQHCQMTVVVQQHDPASQSTAFQRVTSTNTQSSRVIACPARSAHEVPTLIQLHPFYYYYYYHRFTTLCPGLPR